MTVQRGDKTNLLEVKSLAKAMLYMDPEETEYSPIVIHHPFASSGIVGMKAPDGNVKLGNIMENMEDRCIWQKMVADMIDRANSVDDITIHITKPYLLGFVKHAAPMLSKEDFAKTLADAWIQSESPNHDPNLSQSKLLAMFRIADPAVLMNQEERSMLESLDDTVTVYRGVHSSKPGGVKALSWTLDPNTALWFANRFGSQGTVYEAKIDKKHIHGLFLRRGEYEVIVDPKFLAEISQAQCLEQGRGDMTMEGM